MTLNQFPDACRRYRKLSKSCCARRFAFCSHHIIINALFRIGPVFPFQVIDDFRERVSSLFAFFSSRCCEITLFNGKGDCRHRDLSLLDALLTRTPSTPSKRIIVIVPGHLFILSCGLRPGPLLPYLSSAVSENRLTAFESGSFANPGKVRISLSHDQSPVSYCLANHIQRRSRHHAPRTKRVPQTVKRDFLSPSSCPLFNAETCNNDSE